MLAARRQLQEDKGVIFEVQYARRPFFLRGAQENIDSWFRELGLPRTRFGKA